MSFEAGERVRVANRSHDGHHRTPSFVKGKSGMVARVYAPLENPEAAAYGGDGLPAVRLYQVGFVQNEVWDGYGGSRSDRLYVDLYEHWLEAVE
jgi:hypothetical protein